jgi:hypothetical protein
MRPDFSNRLLRWLTELLKVATCLRAHLVKLPKLFQNLWGNGTSEPKVEQAGAGLGINVTSALQASREIVFAGGGQSTDPLRRRDSALMECGAHCPNTRKNREPGWMGMLAVLFVVVEPTLFHTASVRLVLICNWNGGMP